jgi:hypothetical protein
MILEILVGYLYSTLTLYITKLKAFAIYIVHHFYSNEIIYHFMRHFILDFLSGHLFIPYALKAAVVLLPMCNTCPYH